MKKVLSCFLLVMFSCAASFSLYAQGLGEGKDRLGVSAKAVKNTVKPIAPNVSFEKDKLTYNFALSNLMISAPSGASGDRMCSVAVRNNTDHAIPMARYFFNYWYRANSSDRWNQFYGGIYSYAFDPGQSQVVPFHFSVPAGGTQIRVTMHFDGGTGPMLGEISKVVK